MSKLYFSAPWNLVSTIALLVFFLFFGWIVSKNSNITNWASLVLIVFFYGMFLSFLSGMKDGIGSPNSVIPMQGWEMTSLCLLGAVAVVVGAVSLFFRRAGVWQISFYLISGVVIVKTILTEGIRILHYFQNGI